MNRRVRPARTRMPVPDSLATSGIRLIRCCCDLPCYDPARLLVLDRIGEQTIVDPGRGTAGLSDHLPLVLDLAIEKEPGDG
jgi:hypothetical protein